AHRRAAGRGRQAQLERNVAQKHGPWIAKIPESAGVLGAIGIRETKLQANGRQSGKEMDARGQAQELVAGDSPYGPLQKHAAADSASLKNAYALNLQPADRIVVLNYEEPAVNTVAYVLAGYNDFIEREGTTRPSCPSDPSTHPKARRPRVGDNGLGIFDEGQSRSPKRWLSRPAFEHESGRRRE